MSNSTMLAKAAPGPPLALGLIYFLIVYVFLNLVPCALMVHLRDKNPIKNRQYFLILYSGLHSYALLLKFLFEMLGYALPVPIAYTIIFALVSAFLTSKICRTIWLVNNFKARQTALFLNFGLPADLKWLKSDKWCDITTYVRVYVFVPYLCWGIAAIIFFSVPPENLTMWVFVFRIVMTFTLFATMIWCWFQIPADRMNMRREIILTSSIVMGDLILSFLTYTYGTDPLMVGRTLFLAMYICIMSISFNSTVVPVYQALYQMKYGDSSGQYFEQEDPQLKNARVLAVKTYARSEMFTVKQLINPKQLKERSKEIMRTIETGDATTNDDVTGGLYTGNIKDDETELSLAADLQTEYEARFTSGASMLRYIRRDAGMKQVIPHAESALEGCDVAIRIPNGEGFEECLAGACIFLQISGETSTGHGLIRERTRLYKQTAQPKFNYFGFSLPPKFVMHGLNTVSKVTVSVWKTSWFYLPSTKIGEFSFELTEGVCIDETKAFEGKTNGKVTIFCEVSRRDSEKEKNDLKLLFTAANHADIPLKACSASLRSKLGSLAASARAKRRGSITRRSSA